MEIIRYSLVGKEDLNLGIGTFEIRLADGRVVTLSKIDVGALLNDATISTQALTLATLTLTGLTVSGTITVGTATFNGAFNLASGQIAFPATQNPSADANTLDDYEEFTWTPEVGGTATYTSQSGSGIKFGGGVLFRGELTIATIGTGHATYIEGLPTSIICSGHSPISVCNTSGLAIAVTSISGYVGASTSPVAIYLMSRTAAATSDVLNPVLGDGSSITVAGWYPVF